MQCVHCHAEIPDGNNFCTACGRPQNVVPHQATEVMHPQEMPVVQPQPPIPPKGGGNKAPIIIVGIIAVAVVAILAILVFGGVIPTNGASNENTNKNDTEITITDNTNGEQGKKNENSEEAKKDESDNSNTDQHVTINVYTEGDNGTSSGNAGGSSGGSVSSGGTSSSSSSGDYIFPDSSRRYLSASELGKYTDWQLYVGRNEIYARHGRGFKNQDLVSYFAGKSWYHQIKSPEEFDASPSPLNEYEKKNAETIRSVEESRGSSYL